MLIGPLAAAAHHEQVPPAEAVRDRFALTLSFREGPEQKSPWGAHRDGRDDRVIDAPGDTIAVKGDAVLAAPVHREAHALEGFAVAQSQRDPNLLEDRVPGPIFRQ